MGNMDNIYREILKYIILNPDSRILGWIWQYHPQFSHFVDIFGICLKNMSQNRPLFDKHFLKKSISYESWGQATRLKSCAYGSSSYGLFIKKWSIADLITKNRRFLFIKKSEHFFWGKTCFANRGFFGLFMKDYVFLFEYSNIFL